MHFTVYALDAKDDGAPGRRAGAREAHLKNAQKLKSEGKIIMAAAILSEDGRMIGSNIICNFDSREELDSWLEKEPYVKEKVWGSVSIHPCKIAPFCL